MPQTNGLCHTETRFDYNCWSKLPETPRLAFFIYKYKQQEVFDINRASWSELSTNTMKGLFPDSYQAQNLTFFNETCYNYQCNSEPLLENQCIQYEPSDQTYLINNTCPSGEYCPEQEFQSNQSCTNITRSLMNNPGGYCTTNENCYSNICMNHTCIGKKEGENCTFYGDQNCEIGFACIQNGTEMYYCQKQLKQLERCENDYQCQNNAWCVGNVCLNSLSVKEGNIIQGQCQSVNNILISPVCYNLQCKQINEEQMMCIEPLFTEKKEIQTNYIKDCFVESEDTFEFSQIKCDAGNSSKSYCTQHIGNSLGQALIKSIQALGNEGQGVCHTFDRFNPVCWYNRNYAKFSIFQNFFKALKEFTEYPAIQSADSCTQKVYFRDYYTVVYEPDLLKQGSSVCLMLSSILLLLAIFL